MSNFFPQQLSALDAETFRTKRSALTKRPSARHSFRLLERCWLLLLGSGWIVALAMTGMGVTNFCFSGKETGYSSSAMSTNHEGIIQSSKPSSSVPFWIYILLIGSASPWVFTYLRKRSVSSNSKKLVHSDLRSPSSVHPIAGNTSRESEWQGVIPRSSNDFVPPVNSRLSSQSVSSFSQGQKPVSYRISRLSSRSSSAVLSRGSATQTQTISTLSVGAKNIRLPFEQLK